MTDMTTKPERPGGFLDFLPPDYLAREDMLNTITRVFRSFGFDPIETPRIEFLKTLAGETSDTGKNIFHIKSLEDDEPLAMPFDHTVPFARLLAANPYDPKRKTGIRLPWRRMAVGPVFRADTPQSGRYRQFYQFDADIAGTSSMLADAEIVAMIYRTMKALLKEKPFLIRINNRRILNGLAALVKIQDRGERTASAITTEMMRILDKLDKIGLDAVIKQLTEPPETAHDPRPGLSTESAEKIRAFLNLSGSNPEKLNQCREIFKGISIAQEGVEELCDILDFAESMGVESGCISVDCSIARGLDYYTGPVMETVLADAPSFGSVFGGGRYNGLVSRFTGRELPATGASMGVDRFFAALRHLNLIDREKQTVSDVMVLRLEKDRDRDYLKIASKLREAGLNAELSLVEDTTFKGQFNFAISRGVRFAVICGGNEFEKQTVQIKNLQTRKQEEIPRDQLANYFNCS